MSLALIGLVACAGTSEAPAAAESEVVMRLIAFRPETVAISPGASVTWKQQDAGFHTVTSGTVTAGQSGDVDTHPDGVFDSGELAKGEEFSFTFEQAGNFEYFCGIHPATMQARVRVR
jgi:plastocyanin